MKIKKQKNIHYCKNINEVIDILNTSYKSLQVKDIDWYNSNKNSMGTIEVPFSFVEGMSHLLGKTFYGFRAEEYDNYIRIIPDECNFSSWSWSLEMFKEFEDFIIEKK